MKWILVTIYLQEIFLMKGCGAVMQNLMPTFIASIVSFKYHLEPRFLSSLATMTLASIMGNKCFLILSIVQHGLLKKSTIVNSIEIFNILFFNKEDLNKNNRNFSFYGEFQIMHFHLLIVVNIQMEKKLQT